ncbi:MAG: hypothetical protein HYR73_05760, partial [Candidatus Eisenbacteria bacterium]|nr:hypothetical protein [Candidatus Eisenbacteria bacterium]
ITPQIFDIVPGTTFHFHHWYDLEQADSVFAFDGALIEALVNFSGPWLPVTPYGGYTHEAYDRALGVGAPCWSGSSGGWRGESVDLTPYAPGPVAFRFHMAADDFVGREGWYVDHVLVTYPNGETLDLSDGPAAFGIGSPAPNPARDRIAQSLTLARAAHVEWSLFDVAGRRIATLSNGRRGAGPGELAAPIPHPLSSGLYFTRVAIDGRVRGVSRLAIVR